MEITDATGTHADDNPFDVLAALAASRPTRIAAGRGFFELAEQALRADMLRGRRVRQARFRTGLAIGPWLPLWARRRLFGSLHRRLGGGLTVFECRGAPLTARTDRFYRAIGILIQQAPRRQRECAPLSNMAEKLTIALH